MYNSLYTTIVVICVIFGLLKALIDIFLETISLSWMPSGINLIMNHRLFDGNLHVDTIIPIVGTLLDYLAAMLINIVDAMLFPISLIPGLRKILLIVYTSPDWDLFNPVSEAWFSFYPIFQHRSFFTHSVLNPVFLLYLVAFIVIVRLVAKLIHNGGVQIVCFYVFTAIGLSFPCHLLADSMPQGWSGTAFISFKIMGVGFNAGQALTGLWLYINALVALFIIGCIVMRTLGTEE